MEALQTLGFTQEPVTLLLQASDITDLDCRKLVQTNQNQQLKDYFSKLLNKYRIPRLKAIGLRSLGDVFQNSII